MHKYIQTEKYPWVAFGIGVYILGDENFLKLDFWKYELKIGKL